MSSAHDEDGPLRGLFSRKHTGITRATGGCGRCYLQSINCGEARCRSDTQSNLNLAPNTPAIDKGPRKNRVEEVNGERVVQEATSSRGSHRPGFGTRNSHPAMRPSDRVGYQSHLAELRS